MRVPKVISLRAEHGTIAGALAARGTRGAPLLALAIALGVSVAGPACGSSQRASDDSFATQTPREPSAADKPTAPAPTELERRRDTACGQLGPKLTSCAVEDARASLQAGKITRAEFDSHTEAAVLRKHTEEYLKACKAASYSSRQVRVLEVCFRDAPVCSDLLDCLDNLNKPAPSSP
jgi:hypothetical protein